MKSAQFIIAVSFFISIIISLLEEHYEMIIKYIQVIGIQIHRDKHFPKCYTWIISFNLTITFEGPSNISF